MASVAGIPGFDDYAQIDWLQFKHHLPVGSSTFAVLLHPGQSPRLTKLGPRHWIVEYSGVQDHLLLAPTDQTIDERNFSFRGLCAMWRIAGGELSSWAAIRATFLRIDQHTLLDRSTPSDEQGELR
jgi:hypothetical protein